ncbi:hypothetical protein DUI87_28330 [Hirundo rustica rustica]|uniref:Uncharacterized protein n=1 Tax=Hirundo rustica rustica TaxID=333673 RepID=A0A3M0J8Y9_HIRRU|nr:hypothetical protein DUI87_28330 [Hirundo rustica rustica]
MPPEPCVEPPVITKKPHCLVTTTTTISTPPAPPVDNCESTRVVGVDQKIVPCPPNHITLRGDSDSITKEFAPPSDVQCQPELGRGVH